MHCKCDTITGISSIVQTNFTLHRINRDRAYNKIGFREKKIVMIVIITMKNGFTIEDFKLPKNNKILQILHKNKNKYTCFVKRTHYQQASKFFGLFDIIKRNGNDNHNTRRKNL